MLSIYLFPFILFAVLTTGTPSVELGPQQDRVRSPIRPFKSDGPVLIKGVEQGRQSNGAVPLRREIRELESGFPDVWNLYLLGLREFQLADQTSPVSFYQIAGIHGRPYVPWQNAQGIPYKRAGYCPHSNTLFFGWHRAYLALYEQELYKHVQRISSQFPYELADRYLQAAQEFRIPYWDWALSGETTVPECFMVPEVNVTGVDGEQITIPNPLQHYRFHPTYADDFDHRYAVLNTTIRWPSSLEPTAQSQQDLVVDDFNARRVGLHEDLAHGFAVAENFNNFSKTHLESVHGGIHHVIGGTPSYDGVQMPGHMWPLEYSAFEPLFMLHHCNVDRLFNLWIDAHPDLRMETAEVGVSGTFVIKDYSHVDANTPLSPFWKTPTTFWTSNDLWNASVLGYAYPETQYWNFASMDLYRESINGTIAEYYSTDARIRLTNSGEKGTVSLVNLLKEDRSFMDWSIQGTGIRYQMPMSFRVRFSIVGDFSSDRVANAGTWSVLMPQEMEIDMEQMLTQEAKSERVEGSVSLTTVLLDQVAAGKLQSLDAEHVVPYLTDKLTWFVYAGNGTVIPHTELGGLSLMVVSTTVHIPKDPRTPLDYSGPKTTHPEITAGKGGGAKL